MGSSLFVYGSHWAKHIANLSMGRQPNRSISILGLVIAERVTRAIRRKILVSVFGRNMQFPVLSVDAPLHMHCRAAFPSIVNCSEDSSHRSLPQVFLSYARTHILGSFNKHI